MPVTKISTVLGIMALAAVVPSIGGCSASPAPSDDYLQPDVSSRVLQDVQALNYPFESDPSYSVRVANLQTHLINQCVQNQGIVPPVVDDIPFESTAVTPSESRLWLLPSADYGVAAALSDPAVIASLAAAGDGPGSDAEAPPPDPKAYDLAVYGPPDSRISVDIPGVASVTVPVAGCFGEATKSMYGVEDAADYERTYYAIPNVRDVMQALEADSDVRRTVAAWSTCMKAAGYQVTTPSDLYEMMNSWVDGVVNGTQAVSDVRTQETALAQADTACRTSSGFGTTVSQAFLELADQKIAGSEGVIQKYRAMIEHAQSVIAAD